MRRERVGRKRVWGIGCLAVLLGVVVQGFAADPRGIAVKPDQEKRSFIQAVDGYAYLSENMTLKAVREAAFANAKRQAVEAAETRIKSETKVKDFQVEYDIVTAESEGAVRILEQKDLGIENNTRYHVWIKAEVSFDLKPKDPEAVSALMSPSAPLTVKVWTDKKHYRKGEYIRIYLQGNRDFYARVVDVTSTGEIIQLLPNLYRKENRFQGGRVYVIPDARDRFRLEVSEPFGRDRIVVYASESPLGEADLTPIGQGLQIYEGSEASLARRSRAIRPVASEPGPGSGSGSAAEFYEAAWELSTSDGE